MACLAHDPVIALGHEGLEDRRRQVGVVEAGERVPDVVEQRAHHVLLVPPVPMRPRRGLQRVREPVDRIPARVAGEELEVGQHPIRQSLHEREAVRRDDLIVLGRGVGHPRERGPRRHARLVSRDSRAGSRLRLGEGSQRPSPYATGSGASHAVSCASFGREPMMRLSAGSGRSIRAIVLTAMLAKVAVAGRVPFANPPEIASARRRPGDDAHHPAGDAHAWPASR